MRTRDELRILQALPLDLKIRMTKRRVWEWVKEYGEDGVYLSWSGGKDSTVLRHIIMPDFPNIVSVFVNTGLEYPEIQAFVRAAKNRGEPVEILRPEMRFDEVIKKYGYPIISKEISECVGAGRIALERGDGKYSYRLKRLYGMYEEKKSRMYSDLSKYRPLLEVDFRISSQCCRVMKKKPIKQYAKKENRKPITGQMAAESNLRTQNWLQNGCNGFNMKSPISNPMAFWTEQDVLEYIRQNNVEIASVYGEVVYKNEPEQMRLEEFTGETIRCEALCTTGCDRTGCVFCGFGAHLEKGEGRFERLKRTHPRQYEYCIGGGEYNDEGIWQPNKEGLGMGHVFDELNRIYGDGFIRY